MGYIGTGAIGGIVGFYAGAQKLLGIQSQEVARPSTEETPTEDTPTEDTPEETETSSIPESLNPQNGLAYHDEHLYIVSDGEILKINRMTDDIVTRFSSPSNSRPTGLAYGNGSLWFADGIGPDYDGEIVELNPDTGEVRSSITSSWDPRGLAFGGGSLWAVDITSNSIVEFTPDGDRLSSFDTPGVTWGQGLAYFDGSLWLGNNCSGDGCTVSLREYDNDGNQIQRTGERSSSSTAPYAGLAATETELLGPGTDGEVTVLRTL
jgi:streptogramin lyase